MNRFSVHIYIQERNKPAFIPSQIFKILKCRNSHSTLYNSNIWIFSKCTVIVKYIMNKQPEKNVVLHIQDCNGMVNRCCMLTANRCHRNCFAESEVQYQVPINHCWMTHGNTNFCVWGQYLYSINNPIESNTTSDAEFGGVIMWSCIPSKVVCSNILYQNWSTLHHFTHTHTYIQMQTQKS